MDATAVTQVLFAGSIAAGIVVFRHSLTLGDKAPTPLRWLLRVFLGLLVFLAFWGELVYVAWSFGVPLKIGSVANGRIHEAWWFGPAGCVFAMIAYGLLREDTSGDRAWRFSKTVGGAVLVGLGALAITYGLSLLSDRSRASTLLPAYTEFIKTPHRAARVTVEWHPPRNQAN